MFVLKLMILCHRTPSSGHMFPRSPTWKHIPEHAAELDRGKRARKLKIRSDDTSCNTYAFIPDKENSIGCKYVVVRFLAVVSL